MRIDETYDITRRQVGTKPDSAAAMLDIETERRIYYYFREYFQTTEDTRTWNIWTNIPWDEVSTNPSPELVAAVFAAFREDIFLPDYAGKSLSLLRASRGRAWFWTHWSYDEGKHLLAWIEWLTRSGAYTDEALRQYSEEQLAAYRWEPAVADAPGIFWDTLLWEKREIDRLDNLLVLADGQDAPLTALLKNMRADEVAHAEFVRGTLRIIREKYESLIVEAAAKVAAANEIAGGSDALLRLLD